MIKKLLISLIAATAFATSASATTSAPAITFDSLSNVGTSTVWNLGFEFIANQTLDVVALGSLTAGIGGSPVQVGLWNSSGNLLASAAVTGSSTTLNQFSYTSVAPVQLTAGSTYFVASVGYTAYGWNPTNAASSPLITYVKDAWNYNGTTLSFPDKTEGRTSLGDSGFYGANILVTAVPEPETYAMLLAGIGLIGGAVKRRKAKQA